MQKQFLCGSQYFFKDYEDYKIHDTDYVIIDDELEKDYKHIYDKETKTDYFYWKKMSSEEYIKYNEKVKFALDIATFLMKECNEYLNFTIKDLKRLSFLVDKLEQHVGPKYNYYKIIYESYIENNSFILTEEQRLKAYNEYKKYREEYF